MKRCVAAAATAAATAATAVVVYGGVRLRLEETSLIFE